MVYGLATKTLIHMIATHTRQSTQIWTVDHCVSHNYYMGIFVHRP